MRGQRLLLLYDACAITCGRSFTVLDVWVSVLVFSSAFFISVEAENLVRDVVGISSAAHWTESIRAIFLTRRSLCKVSILLVKKVFEVAFEQF